MVFQIIYLHLDVLVESRNECCEFCTLVETSQTVFAYIECAPHIVHDGDTHDRRSQAYQFANLRIDRTNFAFYLCHLNGFLEQVLDYIHCTFRSFSIAGSHSLLLLSGTILGHFVLALGSLHLSFCGLIGSKSFIALLTAHHSLIEEILDAGVGFLSYFCSCHCLLVELISALYLFLAGTGIR